DDRGRRYADIFGTVTGDINLTYAFPGVTTAWHAHNRQYDEWFVIKGALKVGLAIRNADGSFKWRFVSLSEYDGKVLRIPPGVLPLDTHAVLWVLNGAKNLIADILGWAVIALIVIMLVMVVRGRLAARTSLPLIQAPDRSLGHKIAVGIIAYNEAGAIGRLVR